MATSSGTSLALPPREEWRWVGEAVDYDNIPFEPGNETCWQSGVRSFSTCCDTTNSSKAEETCWSGAYAGLSFAACCSFASIRPSPLPRDRRVVITVTTTPHRSHYIDRVLQSLVHQSHEPDAVYLVLPLMFSRDWSWYDTPWFYNVYVSQRLLRILRCEQDYRSQTALLCVLQHEPQPDTYIMVVDDDHVYHPLLLERLLAVSARQPGAMVGAYAYYKPGVWCERFSEEGECVVPNLLHTTHGILLQRRFFDPGIFNFAAAADAFRRLRPDGEQSFDYVVTSCMMQDNLWYESHLSRKAIPRVFLQDFHGNVGITSLAWGLSSIFSGPKGTHHHNIIDPHIDTARGVCNRALLSLWGTSLWAARPRRVAVATLPEGASVRSVAALLDHVGPWQADGVVIFACSRRLLATWRKQLLADGGVAKRIVYLHEYLNANASRGLQGQPSFTSELLDAAAFAPAPLLAIDLPGYPFGGFRPSSFVPGRRGAGTALPLADLVELCPAPRIGPLSGSEAASSLDAAAAAAAAPPPAPASPTRCPDARVIQDACHPTKTAIRPGGFGWAGVRCCDVTQTSLTCYSYYQPRNDTWRAEQEAMLCLPQSASYRDAYFICKAIRSNVCEESFISACCAIGCKVHPRWWLRSPATEECIKREGRLAEPSSWPPSPPPPPLQKQRQKNRQAARARSTAPPSLPRLQQLFLDFSEEARSTQVERIPWPPRDEG